MAENFCPNCGRPNSDDRETCYFCLAVLTETGSGGEDWISSLRSGDDIYREEEDQVDWPSQDDELSGGAAEADRLERIASGPLADTPSDPDLLPEPPVDATIQADQPDWLKDLMQTTAGLSGEETPEDDPEAGLPPDEPPAAMETPAAEPSRTAEPAPAAEPPPAGDIPDWLSELALPEPEEEAPSDEPEPLPDWLTALGDPDAIETFEPLDPPQPATFDPGEGDPIDATEPEQEPETPDADADADWLAGFIDDRKEAPPAPEPATHPEDDSPDWLAGFDDDASRFELPDEQPGSVFAGRFGGPPEPGREPAPAEPASDLPPWLGEFEQTGTAQEEPVEMDTGIPGGWGDEDADFSDFSDETDDSFDEAEPGPEQEPEEVPDWLVSALDQVEVDTGDDLPFEPGAFETPTEEPVEALEPDLGLQDWLSRYDQKTEPDGDPEPEPDDVPGWLEEVNRGHRPDESDQEEAIPDWLRELNEQTPEFQIDGPPQGAGEPEEETDAVDWLPGSSESAAFDMLSEDEGIEEDLAPGELPEWLRAMRPIDATVPGVMETGESDTGSFERVGPLAGLRGVLSAEPSAAQAGRPPSHSVRLQVSDAQQAKANQLQKMVRNETERSPAGRGTFLSEQRVLRYLIAGLLLLTTVFANLVPARMNELPAKPPEMDSLTPLVSGLTPDSVVLVVLDYQPGMSGELDAAAAGVLDHVMLQGARLALISTTPTGPALGERLVRQVEAVHGYTPGDRYVNLGYLPGGATGLQLLARTPQLAAPGGYDARPFWSMVDQNGGSPWAQPAMQGVTGLADFSLTLLLSDDPEMVRRWVEQVGPSLRPGTLVVVASAQAVPLVRPYFETGQIAALVTGLRGGAAYEGFLQREGPAGSAWDGVAVGTLIAVVLILGAGTYNLYLVWNARETLRKGGSG